MEPSLSLPPDYWIENITAVLLEGWCSFYWNFLLISLYHFVPKLIPQERYRNPPYPSPPDYWIENITAVLLEGWCSFYWNFLLISLYHFVPKLIPQERYRTLLIPPTRLLDRKYHCCSLRRMVFILLKFLVDQSLSLCPKTNPRRKDIEPSLSLPPDYWIENITAVLLEGWCSFYWNFLLISLYHFVPKLIPQERYRTLLIPPTRLLDRKYHSCSLRRMVFMLDNPRQ